MLTPLAQADSLRIGTVDFVSPDEIKVLLDIEAPNDVALNAGVPRPFPRINSYALIPSDNGFLVAQIEWITIERSQYPKRKGIQDFGVIDLPYPLRKMSLNPLGILKEKVDDGGGDRTYEFSRGIEVFPTVGDPVLLPIQAQLKALVESGTNRRVNIGVSPLAGNAVVSVDPDRLFGRHLAILGNTGSGKSCSVAGLIRWSIEAATAAKTLVDGKSDNTTNSRFIILDPNGEYSSAFSGLNNVQLYSVDSQKEGMNNLQVPIWFWNSTEWSAFTQASAKTQRPILRRALRDIRRGNSFNQSDEEAKLLDLRRYLSFQFMKIRSDMASNVPRDEATKFGHYLRAVLADVEQKKTSCPSFIPKLACITSSINTVLASTFKSFPKNGETIEYYNAFSDTSLQIVLDSIHALLESLGGLMYREKDMGEDIPLPFKVGDFANYVQMLGIEENSSQFIDFLVMRIRALLADSRIGDIAESEITLSQWLSDYISPTNSSEGSITIIDLSLVPADVVHIITAVISRMILESLQRYRKLSNGQTLPTTIIMEEAHTFVKRYHNESDEISASSMCAQVFEKIAREGRKFGLGLVLSSQRPSELSPTVLSQCNTFLLHRISNDQDQELVKKLVPDNLRGLLRELPSLPSRNAILLGWASELPVSVQMNFLRKEHQPKSDDPDYWDVWTGNKSRMVDWGKVAADWQNPSGELSDGAFSATEQIGEEE